MIKEKIDEIIKKLEDEDLSIADDIPKLKSEIDVFFSNTISTFNQFLVSLKDEDFETTVNLENKMIVMTYLWEKTKDYNIMKNKFKDIYNENYKLISSLHNHMKCVRSITSQKEFEDWVSHAHNIITKMEDNQEYLLKNIS